jgi:hypothetical protein
VLVAVRATVAVTALVTVAVTPPVTAGTTLADAAVTGPDAAGTGTGWPWACDPPGCPGAAGPRPWVTLWTVCPTLASAPPAGDWPALPPGAPDGACPGGVLAASAAGPVPEPPDPPGMMSWVTPLTADTAALAAGALAAGALAAGALAAGAGTWFAAPLAAGAAGAGTLAARAAGEETALAAGAWLAGPGWPAELGWPAEAGWAGGCGAGSWPAELGWPADAGWAGGCGAGSWPAEDGPWLPPLPCVGVPPGPGRRLWAAPATEPAADAALPGRLAVSPLTPAAAAEPGLCAEVEGCADAGFWSADARPASSTAKTSAAARAPHAYRQTLTTSNKARERVADPSTANTLPPDPGNYPYFPYRRTTPDLLSCPRMGRLPA